MKDENKLIGCPTMSEKEYKTLHREVAAERDGKAYEMDRSLPHIILVVLGFLVFSIPAVFFTEFFQDNWIWIAVLMLVFLLCSPLHSHLVHKRTIRMKKEYDEKLLTLEVARHTMSAMFYRSYYLSA